MTAKKLLCFAVFTASLVAGIGPAFGQDCTDKEKAKTHYRQGYEFFTQEKYKEAIEQFTIAQKFCPAPPNLYNIAKSHEKLANFEEAIKFYKGYLESYRKRKGKLPPDFKSINETIKTMQDKLTESFPLLVVRSTPKGATVYLNNKDTVRGTTPFQTNLRPGTHTLFLELPGYEPFKTEFTLEKKKNLTLEFQLTKTLRVGYLAINVNVRGAKIYVDGKVIGISPYRDKILVNEGKHQVVVEHGDKYTKAEDIVDIRKGDNVTRSYKLKLISPPISWRGAVGWTFIGVGLAGIGTGILFKFLADKKFNDTSSFKLRKNLSITGYAVGSVLIGAGIGLVVWEYTRSAVDEKDLVYVPRLQLIPSKGGTVGVGASWGWTF